MARNSPASKSSETNPFALQREKQPGGLDNAAFQIDDEPPHVERTACSRLPGRLDLQQVEVGKERARATWNNSVEFLMSCIAVSVGFGNIWRFPFTAYENGGGAFLVPYVILLFLVGKPFYFLEMIIGQFSGSSSVKVWGMSPGFVGKNLYFSFERAPTNSRAWKSGGRFDRISLRARARALLATFFFVEPTWRISRDIK